MIVDTLRKITNNFETGFTGTTLLGYYPEYDSQGRPLNADPNYRSGEAIIDGHTYYFVRKGWKVRAWDKPTSYMSFLNDKQDFIAEIDLTPEYLQARAEK